MLEGNIVCVRFDLLCNVGVFARNKSSVRQICFTQQRFFLLETKLPHTIFISSCNYYICVFSLPYKYCVSPYTRFVLSYNALICSRNKTSKWQICFILKCFFVVKTNLACISSVLQCNAFVYVFSYSRFVLLYNVCICVINKSSVHQMLDLFYLAKHVFIL